MGGGEKERLPRLRQVGDHPLHVADEAHVQHAVGFVQHEDLDGIQADIALADQVIEAAGRGNHDIHPALQLRGLGLLADAAENHRGDQRRCFAP